VGIHRTFDLNVIRSGLRSDSLATLLFPRDPVANAPALLQALAASFPARQGSYLFGLLARITWLTPTVVQADLAVILELGQRSRLLVLGRVSAMLPSHDNDLIRLILDADGVLDFNAKTFDADAVLVHEDGKPVGVLTRLLASRCDTLLSCDVAAAAVASRFTSRVVASSSAQTGSPIGSSRMSTIRGSSSTTSGAISISARGRGSDDVEIIFADNGAGMTPDVQRQAFDPFFTTRRNEGGTGLGLHIVYNLVTQQLGGRMMLESRLGQGTTFRIIMPKVAKGGPVLTDPTAADGTSQWPNRTMSST